MTNAELRDNEPKPVCWRYQRKDGWGTIWRYVDELPTDFENPDDWTVQPLYLGTESG